MSLLCVTESGDSSEIASVGNEGVVGIPIFLGRDSAPILALVQSAGSCYRIRASIIRAEFARASGLQHLLLRYMQNASLDHLYGAEHGLRPAPFH